MGRRHYVFQVVRMGEVWFLGFLGGGGLTFPFPLAAAPLYPFPSPTLTSFLPLPVEVLFCSLAVLDPRVGHTMDVLSPFIPVLCHSD